MCSTTPVKRKIVVQQLIYIIYYQVIFRAQEFPGVLNCRSCTCCAGKALCNHFVALQFQRSVIAELFIYLRWSLCTVYIQM